MDKELALSAIMLSELPHLGEQGMRRIVERSTERGHGVRTFLRLPEAVLRETFALHPLAVRRLVAERELHEQRCAWLLDRLAAVGGTVHLLGTPTWPERLRRDVAVAPPVLYRIGPGELLERPTLAVLNSRSISDHSVSATRAVVEAAAAQGFTVVTGGMKTGYRIAAVASRVIAAPRTIVLDRGALAVFGARADRDPFGFGPGRAVLDAARTLVVSPFRLLDHATPRNGRRRDELIALLADVVVAVHARPGGQIEHVCLAALDRGQSVLSWYGENAGLVAAGAAVATEDDLTAGLTRYVSR